MTIGERYNLDLEITYKNNEEYRTTLRQLFFMDVSNCKIDETIDNETRDELMYDENTVNLVMNELFYMTAQFPLFQELYDIAAAKMISTDKTIGQAVLFSYDYLALFHKCLACFIKSPDTFDENNEYYVALLKKIV
uniref:Uncharacterized protein n=1 Tax=viral metagenome TaxID=1070528 RepID=A0A6C0B8B9_9ZZZZ